MRFVCESCRAQYMINDEKVGPKGVKVRCRKCGYVILVKRGGDAQAKGPVASAGADPDDALATQILQTPLTAAPPAAAKSMAGDTLADLTNPGVPEGKSQAPHDSLLGDAGDDEIGAVF
ncbi:MAG: agmX, partial [Myxococcaceae bacterium]|nr:agmX [Myxococcaceae bacterium]